MLMNCFKNTFSFFSRLQNFSMLSLFLLIMPTSNTYTLESHAFGSGGLNNASSSAYGLHALSGEMTASNSSSSLFSLLPGLMNVQMSAKPNPPIWQNVDDDYNKLFFILDNSDFPTDAQFALSISTDNFVTTSFVKSDGTTSISLSEDNWQTHAEWGANSGQYVVGLLPNTSYQLRVMARHGIFTQGPWSESVSAQTSPLKVNFNFNVSQNNDNSLPPFVLSLGEVSPGNTITSTEKIWISMETNAKDGMKILGVSLDPGLQSVTTGHSIPLVAGNLDSMNEGVGIQVHSINQSSGGPIAAAAPFNGGGNVVGSLNNNAQVILHSSQNKINNGVASLSVKARTDFLTPAANDYVANFLLLAVAEY